MYFQEKLLIKVIKRLSLPANKDIVAELFSCSSKVVIVPIPCFAAKAMSQESDVCANKITIYSCSECPCVLQMWTQIFMILQEFQMSQPLKEIKQKPSRSRGKT